MNPDATDCDRDFTTDEMCELVNEHDRTVKVLARAIEGGPNEGVWIFRVAGDNDNGIGILSSNILAMNVPYDRGDLVHYRTLDPQEKPRIVNWHDGSND